jgi:hypothetical protein
MYRLPANSGNSANSIQLQDKIGAALRMACAKPAGMPPKPDLEAFLGRSHGGSDYGYA